MKFAPDKWITERKFVYVYALALALCTYYEIIVTLSNTVLLRNFPADENTTIVKWIIRISATLTHAEHVSRLLRDRYSSTMPYIHVRYVPRIQTSYAFSARIDRVAKLTGFFLIRLSFSPAFCLPLPSTDNETRISIPRFSVSASFCLVVSAVLHRTSR